MANGADAGTSITVGAEGKLYLTGATGSADFPVTSGAFHTTLSSSQDVFLMRLDPASLARSYSTFLAQGSSSVVSADTGGNAYVAASTTSTARPGTTKCHGDRVELRHPVELGWRTHRKTIAVDSAGNTYVGGAAVGMGTTSAGLLPVMSAVQQQELRCFGPRTSAAERSMRWLWTARAMRRWRARRSP